MSRLIRMKEVKAKLGVSESTVRRMVEKGVIPKGKKLSDRMTVWNEKTIDDYINSF